MANFSNRTQSAINMGLTAFKRRLLKAAAQSRDPTLAGNICCWAQSITQTKEPQKLNAGINRAVRRTIGLIAREQESHYTLLQANKQTVTTLRQYTKQW